MSSTIRRFLGRELVTIQATAAAMRAMVIRVKITADKIESGVFYVVIGELLMIFAMELISSSPSPIECTILMCLSSVCHVSILYLTQV
jgi:hypothetical protein